MAYHPLPRVDGETGPIRAGVAHEIRSGAGWTVGFGSVSRAISTSIRSANGLPFPSGIAGPGQGSPHVCGRR